MNGIIYLTAKRLHSPASIRAACLIFCSRSQIVRPSHWEISDSDSSLAIFCLKTSNDWVKSNVAGKRVIAIHGRNSWLLGSNPTIKLWHPTFFCAFHATLPDPTFSLCTLEKSQHCGRPKPSLGFLVWSGQPPSRAKFCFFWTDECFEFIKFTNLRNGFRFISIW